MRLTQPPAPGTDWAALEFAVSRGLARRLDPSSDSPVAVAFSGGGDSLALLLAARSWARRTARPLIALTVDHGLSPLSAGWTRWCAERADGLGLGHRVLSWDGPKPARGVSATARSARHRLLADAAREAGAGVLLMGHTADDRLEARLMRQEGSSVSEPREWSPSPMWPEGRGVFILRPLIDTRRETIRRALRERGETWLDDPANTEASSLRARVRAKIAGGGDPGPVIEPPAATDLLRAASVGWAGDIAIPLEALRAATASSRDRFLGAALLCAAGTTSPPRGEAVARLWARLRGASPMAATLAGCRIERDDHTVRFLRDDGAMGAGALQFGMGSAVFDGRFEVFPIPNGATLTAMSGHMARLGTGQRDRIRDLPPAARRALPALVAADGSTTCPLIPNGHAPAARSRVGERLAAALGAVDREAAIERVGEIARGVLDTTASLERTVHEPA